jgi:DNA (cytosine-5)-methyltransferase 1
MRPRLLDLFCGAGGAAMGYHRAGFDVVGVDINLQPRYPFEFHQADAMTFPLAGFDAIHASPPCQAYSIASVQQRQAGIEYPDLVAAIRARLEATELPWVIENVPGAPIRPDIILCGCLFNLPLLRRVRWFETSWDSFQLRAPCSHIGPGLSVTGHGIGAGNGQRARIKERLGRNPGIAEARAAMGIDWMTRGELVQAIPPAYTEHIGAQLLTVLNSASFPYRGTA